MTWTGWCPRAVGAASTQVAERAAGSRGGVIALDGGATLRIHSSFDSSVEAMAKLKKTARKSGAQSKPDLQKQAEQFSKHLGESAQQVWLAGVGAFQRAQSEGSKMFETLVKEGLSVEQNTRKVATGKVEAVRDAVESTVGQARERASDTWDRLEKVFEERVQRAMRRLEVPSREDLSELVDRVDALNSELRNLGPASRARKAAAAKKSSSGASKRAGKPAAKKTANKRVAKKASVKKAPAKKAARKSASKKQS